MAMEKGMTVWSSVEFEEEAFFEGLLLLEPPTWKRGSISCLEIIGGFNSGYIPDCCLLPSAASMVSVPSLSPSSSRMCDPPVQRVQNTVSQVSQKRSSCNRDRVVK